MTVGYEEKRDLELKRLTMKGHTAEDEKRYERAQSLIAKLRELNEGESTAAWQMGQYLSHMHVERLWEVEADTWKEFVDSLGYTHPTEHMRRTNYQLYIEELGLEMDDPRLLSAADSKLNLGTKSAFRDYVVENIRKGQKKREPYLKKLEKLWGEFQAARKAEDVEKAGEIEQQIIQTSDEMERKVHDFIDLCQPVDDGGLSRADLRRYLEEEIGISQKGDKSQFGKVFKTLRKAREEWHEMTEDEYLSMMQELQEDEDLSEWLQSVLSAWREASRHRRKPRVAHTELPEEVMSG